MRALYIFIRHGCTLVSRRRAFAGQDAPFAITTSSPFSFSPIVLRNAMSLVGGKIFLRAPRRFTLFLFFASSPFSSGSVYVCMHLYVCNT